MVELDSFQQEPPSFAIIERRGRFVQIVGAPVTDEFALRAELSEKLKFCS